MLVGALNQEKVLVEAFSAIAMHCETSNIAKVSPTAMALTRVVLQDGIKWHDIECRHKKPIICQESQELLDYALGDYDEYEDYYYDY